MSGNNCDSLAADYVRTHGRTARDVMTSELITVGDQEQASPRRFPLGVSREVVEAEVRDGRMVDNAWELGTRLEKLKGDGYHACFHAFEDEDHLTCTAAAENDLVPSPGRAIST